MEGTYFFCSFLFFSAGPPRVPMPKLSLGEVSASGVPAKNINTVRDLMEPLMQN